MGITENTIRVVVPERLSRQRADKVVAELAGVSRTAAKAMLEGGSAVFDGQSVAPSSKVSAGAQLEATPPVPFQLEAEEVGFEVLLEDDHLAVVDKPPGLVVHPGAGQRRGTLAAGVLFRWPQVEGVGEQNRWGIVHRLDKDTSGCLLIAKTAQSHGLLSQAIQERRVDRWYLALVIGTFDIPTGTIEAAIGRDPNDATRYAVVGDGRHAVTHYEAIEEVDGVTLLRIKLETGRTHQIRVHMASIGHPVCGDGTYGAGGGPTTPRIFLHAGRMRLLHPVTGDELDVTSPLPSDLASVL